MLYTCTIVKNWPKLDKMIKTDPNWSKLAQTGDFGHLYHFRYFSLCWGEGKGEEVFLLICLALCRLAFAL